MSKLLRSLMVLFTILVTTQILAQDEWYLIEENSPIGYVTSPGYGYGYKYEILRHDGSKRPPWVKYEIQSYIEDFYYSETIQSFENSLLAEDFIVHAAYKHKAIVYRKNHRDYRMTYYNNDNDPKIFQFGNYNWDRSIFSFANENLAYGYAYDSLFRIINGNLEFIRKIDGMYNMNWYTIYNQIEFLNDSIGFILLYDDSGSNSDERRSYVYRTSDSGKTWDSTYINTVDYNSVEASKFLTFLDDSTGIILAGSKVLISTNQGVSWETYTTNLSDTIVISQIANNGRSIYAIEMNRYPNRAHYIYQSNDTGKSWTISEINTLSNQMISLTCPLWDRCYVVSSINNIYSNREPTGIKENGKIDLKLYPNPVTDFLELELPEEFHNYRVNIYDLEGLKVLTLENKNRLDLSSLYSGMYLVKVQTKDKIYTKRIVKQ